MAKWWASVIVPFLDRDQSPDAVLSVGSCAFVVCLCGSLAGNPLKGVPASIQKCQNLQFVDLRDTDIDSLPQEMSRLPKLADVGLSHRALKPKLAAAYASGTQKLMEYLARKDEKRALKDALRKRFTFEVGVGWGPRLQWCGNRCHDIPVPRSIGKLV
jgi:hypothetical protein